MKDFDPNATGKAISGIFALPYGIEESLLVLVPVPWDVTTSYGKGTSRGPDAILASSRQMDLCDPQYGEFYSQGIFMETPSKDWISKNMALQSKAGLLQKKLEAGQELSSKDLRLQQEINQESKALNTWLEAHCDDLIGQGKIPCVVGGDHSSPFGLMAALNKKYRDLSVLHIDAHLDLRKAYQGFEDSHASIMRNAIERLNLKSLVQIGIRDYCPEEQDFAKNAAEITTFFDGDIQRRLHFGESWAALCKEFFQPLSPNVYISFDIDGLSPDLCPHTGTPVPGGMDFPEVSTLLAMLKTEGFNVVGFDLCEVAPEAGNLDGWDGNVGARVLYKLCGTVLESSAT